MMLLVSNYIFLSTFLSIFLGNLRWVRLHSEPIGFKFHSSKICLTLSLLMSYIYRAPSKARNLASYIYGRDFLLGILLLEPCVSFIYA
jgi:hypothetical protein